MCVWCAVQCAWQCAMAVRVQKAAPKIGKPRESRAPGSSGSWPKGPRDSAQTRCRKRMRAARLRRDRAAETAARAARSRDTPQTVDEAVATQNRQQFYPPSPFDPELPGELDFHWNTAGTSWEVRTLGKIYSILYTLHSTHYTILHLTSYNTVQVSTIIHTTNSLYYKYVSIPN